MRTRINQRRIRFPALREDSLEERIELVVADEKGVPGSSYIALSQEYGMPALEQYLRELRALGSRMPR